MACIVLWAADGPEYNADLVATQLFKGSAVDKREDVDFVFKARELDTTKFIRTIISDSTPEDCSACCSCRECHETEGVLDKLQAVYLPAEEIAAIQTAGGVVTMTKAELASKLVSV
mgnify:CR=1 FL=1